MKGLLCLVLLSCSGAASWAAERYDIMVANGTIYDGSGEMPYQADVGIVEDRIAALGDLDESAAVRLIDATGLAVAPGFINMLSWASTSLLIDGASQSDIRQGVTLEVFGEGSSMGPLNDAMKVQLQHQLDPWGAKVAWSTLGEYLEHLTTRGVAANVASFVGATTVRVHELGLADRKPSARELVRMQALVEQAMAEGALGVGSALIYAPGFYADTAELIALAQAAAKHGGMYISHMRSEGNRLLEAIDELIAIAAAADSRAEIYHLKVAGNANWPKYDQAIARIETARAAGQAITANMYTYTAGSTGLDAAMPPWSQEGGYQAWRERLRDPEIRRRIAREMTTPSDEWENLLLAAGADNVLLVGFRNPELRAYAGRTLAEVAALEGRPPHEMAMDLVVADGSRVQAVYFLMNEQHVAATAALPWVSFGSDADSIANEGIFIERSTHPRTYGNFARLLGKYVRQDRVLSLPLAIRKLTQLPAQNLRIRQRGELRPGYFADLAVFDASKIIDHATYAEPHRYSAGMVYVLVNGELVLANGEHTGALPGRVVRGPGWQGWHVAPQQHIE